MTLKKLLRIVILVTLLAGVCYLFFYIYSTSQKTTITNLVTYLNNQGLPTKVHILPKNEVAIVQEFNQALEKISPQTSKKDNQIIEGDFYDIGRISQIRIDRYASVNDANIAYAAALKREAQIESDPQRINRSEYLRAGQFIILRIDYYDIEISNGKIDIGSIHTVTYPEEDLTKLRRAVAMWQN